MKPKLQPSAIRVPGYAFSVYEDRNYVAVVEIAITFRDIDASCASSVLR